MLIEKMRDALHYTSMTTDEIGDKVGVTGAAISAYKNGKSKPPYDRYEKIMEALGYKIEVKATWF